MSLIKVKRHRNNTSSGPRRRCFLRVFPQSIAWCLGVINRGVLVYFPLISDVCRRLRAQLPSFRKKSADVGYTEERQRTELSESRECMEAAHGQTNNNKRQLTGVQLITTISSFTITMINNYYSLLPRMSRLFCSDFSKNAAVASLTDASSSSVPVSNWQSFAFIAL